MAYENRSIQLTEIITEERKWKVIRKAKKWRNEENNMWENNEENNEK